MNYQSLTINQKVNAKGNARLLYTTFSTQFCSEPGRILSGRIIYKNATIFSPDMLLDNNTKTI